MKKAQGLVASKAVEPSFTQLVDSSLLRRLGLSRSPKSVVTQIN
jgi:hypothetical protein